MNKRIFALLLTFCLFFTAAPICVGAATGQQISAGTVTVTAGNTATVTITAEDFSAVATVEFFVYYDPAVLTLSSTANGSLLSGAQSSVNTAVAGTVKMVAMSLNGISGTGNLLSLYFKTAADCAPGTYPITVAVGNAYNTSFAPAAIGAVNGSITVNKQVATETFSVYGSTDKSSLRMGDILSYRVAGSSSRPFVSGEFVVSYDHEVFAFDSVSLESALTGEGAIWSVNASVLGQVRIAYANSSPVKNFYLFSVKLKVIANKSDSTTLSAQASNMYREDLSMYLPGSCSNTVTLQELPSVIDYPDVFLVTDALVVGQRSGSVFMLEAGAEVAAADFVLNYDPAVLRCVSVEKSAELDALGGMLVVNDNFDGGKIRFSYINMDSPAEDIPVAIITWDVLCAPADHYQVTASGVGVVDAKQNPLKLEYVPDTGCIYNREVVEPTCVNPGFTTYTCSCGESFTDEYTTVADHDYTEDIFVCGNCGHERWAVALSVQTVPDKTLYYLGESALDVTGGEIAVSFDDGTIVVMDMTEAMAFMPDAAATGVYTVVVTFAGVSAGYEISFTERQFGIVSHPADVAVVAGFEAVFTVEATDVASYTWQYRRNENAPWVNTTLGGNKTNTLTVPAILSRNGYQYRCRITGNNGKILYTEPATMTVLDSIIITSQPTRQIVNVDANATFTLIAEGAGLTYQWLYRKSDDDFWKQTGMEGNKTNTLTVPAILTRNGYQYMCAITDENGIKINSKVSVLSAIGFVTHPEDQCVPVNTQAAFSVTAEGQELVYQWQYRKSEDGSWFSTSLPGATTDTLTVEALASRNGYQYRCRITDALGTIRYSEEATLTVE